MLVQSVSVFSLAVFLWALLPEIKWMMMMINCYEQLPIPLLDELCCTTALFIKNSLEAAVFVGFPTGTNAIFCTKKQACYRTAGPISHRAARCGEFLRSPPLLYYGSRRLYMAVVHYNLATFGREVPGICSRTERQTDTYTTLLRHPNYRGRVSGG